jgi:TolA-binding protein
MLVVAAASLLLPPPAAVSSERAEILYSRGLVEFHANRFEPALDLFRQAVAANPSDAYARYYLGVTRGRTGDFAGAAADLQAALEVRPDLDEAALELGVALVELGRNEEALAPLAQAQANAPLEGQASLFLGLAQLRLGRDDLAQANFDRAAAADPELRVSGRYYQGVAAYRAGRWRDAEEHFAAVVADRPDSAMGREANKFLDAVRVERVRAYELYAAVGLEYDSNVPLETDESIQSPGVPGSGDFGDPGDGRVTLAAGGRYSPLLTEAVSISLGYDFFQSLHFDLTEFDLQDHRPSLQLAGRIDNFRWGILGRYDHYLLDLESFLDEATAFPWVGYALPDFGRTEISYRMRYRNFYSVDIGDFNIRDAFNHAPGIRQVVEILGPDRYVFAGYRYDREDPTRSEVDAERFAYDGHEFNTGVSWALPADITGDFAYAYRHEQYDDASREDISTFPFDERRNDDEHHFTVVAAKEFLEYFRVRLAYFGTINDSNQNAFQYDRHIGSVTLEVRY